MGNNSLTDFYRISRLGLRGRKGRGKSVKEKRIFQTVLSFRSFLLTKITRDFRTLKQE